MPGVWRTRVGYAGGTTKNPTYHDLGDHTESFQVDFDPEKVSYADLLAAFWAAHNPCAKGGSRQYRSALFYAGEDQKQAALESKAALEKDGRRVLTDIEALGAFTLAEDYHQKYALRNTRDLMREFRTLLPRDADFVDSTAAARVNAWLSGEGTAAQLEAELGKLGLSEGAQALLRKAVAGRR